jgi:ketosteroid isomerase-like protein
MVARHRCGNAWLTRNKLLLKGRAAIVLQPGRQGPADSPDKGMGAIAPRTMNPDAGPRPQPCALRSCVRHGDRGHGDPKPSNRSELSGRVRQCRYVRRGPGRDFLDPTQPREEWEDAMDPAQDVLATVERFNDVFNQKDVEAVMEMMTPDVVFENTSGGRFEGQETVRAVLDRAFGLMSAGWFETEEIMALGDRAVVLWKYVLDKEHPERGHIRGADVFRVRGDRVAEKFSYVKSEEFVQKLGLQLPSS